MAFWLLAGLAAVHLVLFEYQQRRQRRTLLATFRSEWGHPLEHTRDLPMIAAYHRALVTEGAEPIEERTAKDLDLDALFAALDQQSAPSAVFEVVNTMLLLDANVLYFASKEIWAKRHELLRTIAAVGTVDTAVGVASYRADTTGWTRPILQSGPGASTTLDLRHPLLDEAVPNSIELGPPHGVLITGSNMSGKSTFLRTIGVNAVLAQTVNTCLAEEYRAPRFTIRSVIGRSDDMATGKSYYRDEVEAVLALVHASRSDSPHLLLFDELFRGTSTVERIAAAEATLAELVNSDSHGGTHTPHVVIASTHDRELVDLMRDAYAPYHFSDTVDADGLSFDYCLRTGPAQSWNAIALLEMCGAPQRLVRRALTRTTGLGEQQRLPHRR